MNESKEQDSIEQNLGDLFSKSKAESKFGTKAEKLRTLIKEGLVIVKSIDPKDTYMVNR